MRIKSCLKHIVTESYLTESEGIEKGEVLDCALGINHFGVSQRVVEAAKEYNWSRVCYYPDPTYKDLKETILKFWSGYANLATEQIQIAHGASSVLDKLNKIFIEPGSKVLGYSPQWPDYAAWVEACGGEYEAIELNPEEGFKFDVNRLVAKITDEYCLIFIDNPNNPTGQVISREEIEEILKQAERKEVVVVVDEAYGDYMDKEDSSATLMGKNRNLVVVRSFSKGLGLAGLRVGYGIFPLELSKHYAKIDVPISVSAAGAYLAKAALADEDFIRGCRKTIQREKAKLIKGLKEIGYLVGVTHDTCPIFLLGHKDKGANLRQELLEKRILTVGCGHYRNLGDNSVRVNTPCKAEEFLSCL